MRMPNYEQALIVAGVDSEFHQDVLFEDINWKRGLLMQARSEVINQPLVDQYEQLLRQGSEPPPLLLWRQGQGKWVNLDGNQRVAARNQAPKKFQWKSIDAYILTTKDEMVASRICWTWNNLVNGLRLSYEECKNHAITMIRKFAYAISAAATEWGVKQSDLQAAITELEMRDIAMKHKIKLADSLGTSIIVQLAGLRKLGDDITAKALEACSNNGLGVKEALDLMKTIRDASTSKEKLKAVDDFVKTESVQRLRAETKGGRIRLPTAKLPRYQLQNLLNQLANLLSKYEDRAFRPVGKEEKDIQWDMNFCLVNRLIGIHGLGKYLKQRRKDNVA